MRYVIALLVLTACTVPGPVAPRQGEAGMWSICYDEEGWPELHEFRNEIHSCKNPERIHWGSLPVDVHIDSSMDTDVVLRAFSAWEEWLGVPVFRLVPESGRGVVEIWADADDLRAVGCSLAAACAPHMKYKGQIEAIVVFDPAYAKRVDILAHELGHTLGLAHDRSDKRSIMYPGPQWYLPRLNPYDRYLLCSLYRC